MTQSGHSQSESMRSKYKKNEAPPWQGKLVLVFWGRSSVPRFCCLWMWAVILLIDWARVDDCLDMGGSYDYERGECDLESNHIIPEN